MNLAISALILAAILLALQSSTTTRQRHLQLGPLTPNLSRAGRRISNRQVPAGRSEDRQRMAT